MSKWIVLAGITAISGLAGCGGNASTTTVTPTPTPTPTPTLAVTHVLFVGDSFTHGRYQPVRQYGGGGVQAASAGSALVVDENFGQTGARAESAVEPGPQGGIPGIFAQFAVEAGLGPGGTGWDVHEEAISATSLQKNYAAAPTVIAETQWNAVVLQEISTRPISKSFTNDSTSNPSIFCTTVQTIEHAVHGAAAGAKIYLYETWARADMAQALSGATTAAGFGASYSANLAAIGNAYHDVYYRAAAVDGSIAAVAPAGEAWTRAWSEGIANSNPYTVTSSAPVLAYGLNAVNDPVITTADYSHPSVYGAYLSALVLFQQLTGVDVRTLGPSERSAAALGINATTAVQLQKVAWETVTNENSTLINQTVDPCTLTS